MTAAKKKQRAPGVWGFVRWYWPYIAGVAAVALGTSAFIVFGNLLDDVKKAQEDNDKLTCAVTRTITANPIKRIPGFQTEEEFRRSLEALNLILVLAKPLDCDAVLGPVIATTIHSRPAPQARGGGAQSPSSPPGGQ